MGRKRRGEGRREGGKGWRGRKGSGEREEEEMVEAEGEKHHTYANFYHDIITITNFRGTIQTIKQLQSAQNSPCPQMKCSHASYS